MSRFAIGNRQVGEGQPVLVIAEVAQAHDGSVNLAHSFVDAVASAGADAVKFQTHIAEAESSPQEEWRVRFSRQDATRYDYWARMGFSKAQWRELKTHAEERGLVFLSSPFSIAAVELLLDLGIQAWKVASGEVRNVLLLDRLVSTNLPILLSSGMSDLAEVGESVRALQKGSAPFLVMQCTSAYPCPPERVGLNVLAEMRERFHCEVGLSDHSGTIWPCLAATVLGAKAVEVHVLFDRAMFSPDASASITMTELKDLVSGIRFTEAMLANPVTKDSEKPAFSAMRTMFGQSLVAARDLPTGAVLGPADLSSRKPQVGIPVSMYAKVLGSRICRPLTAGEFIYPADIEKCP